MSDSIVHALRSALYLIRKDGTNIGQHVADELRLAVKLREVENEINDMALALCIKEIEQLHSHYHPKCAGGCPAQEALRAARAARRTS